MAKKSNRRRLQRLEGVCIGAGFLLKKLRAQYGNDFGEGMWQQVNACINDCDQIGRAIEQRKAAMAQAQQGGAL